MWRTRRTRDIAQLGSSATEDSGVAIGAAADATAQDGVEEAPRAGSTWVAATAFSTASTAMEAVTVSPGAFCKRVKKSQERILRPRPEEVAETQNEEADSNISAESDGNVENEENKGHCTTWVKCNGWILAWPSVQRRTLLLKMGWWRWWRPCVQEVRELPQRLFQWHQLPWKPPLCHLGPFARGWRRVRKGFWDPDWGSCRNPEWRGWFQYHCRVRWQCGERERGEQGTLHNLGQVQWRILAWPSVQRRTLLLKMGWWRWWRPCVQEVRELPQRLFQWHQLPWKPPLCHLGPFARGWRRVRKGFWDPDWGSCRNPEWRGWFQYHCRVRWQCGERERGEQGTLHNLGQVQRRILAWPSVQRRTLLLKMGWWRWWRPCVQEVRELPQRLFQWHQLPWKPPLCHLGPFARGWRRVRKGFWDPDWGSCRNPEWRGWFQYHCRVRWQCGERERGEQGTLHNLGQVQWRILAWPSVQRRTLLLKMGWWRWWRPCVQEVRELPQRLFQWHQLPWKPSLCHLGPFARGWRRVRKGFWDPDWGSCRNPEWRGWFQYQCRVRWQCGRTRTRRTRDIAQLGSSAAEDFWRGHRCSGGRYCSRWGGWRWWWPQTLGWWWWRPCVQEVCQLPQRLFQRHQMQWQPPLCQLALRKSYHKTYETCANRCKVNLWMTMLSRNECYLRQYSRL